MTRYELLNLLVGAVGSAAVVVTGGARRALLGGTVITQAGDHEKVKALVYVVAFAPGTSSRPCQGLPDPSGSGRA